MMLHRYEFVTSAWVRNIESVTSVWVCYTSPSWLDWTNLVTSVCYISLISLHSLIASWGCQAGVLSSRRQIWRRQKTTYASLTCFRRLSVVGGGLSWRSNACPRAIRHLCTVYLPWLLLSLPPTKRSCYGQTARYAAKLDQYLLTLEVEVRQWCWRKTNDSLFPFYSPFLKYLSLNAIERAPVTALHSGGVSRLIRSFNTPYETCDLLAHTEGRLDKLLSSVHRDSHRD